MDFEVYCDESCLEALSNKNEHKYIAIGGIWIPADNRKSLKDAIKTIKEKYNIYGEFKWNKLSPAYFDFYKNIIDYFFSSELIRFRAIIIESKCVDNYKFNNDDNELSFYKFYYQLLHHWIYDFNSYSIYLDYKINRDKGRLRELKRILMNANITSNIKVVQSLPSEQSIGIQLADVLTGIVSAKFNATISSKAKLSLIKHIEENFIGKEISPTSKGEEKFNIFHINLKGGW